jgi:hypothetical protein
MVGLLGSIGVRDAMKRCPFSFMFRHLNTMIQTLVLDVFNLQCGVDEQRFHRLNLASQPDSFGGFSLNEQQNI